MKKYSGYSLIELLVALVILGILMSVGAPKIGAIFRGNHSVVNANDLLAGLHLARSEAIKRNSRVSICKSTNADSGAPTCATGAEGWEKGWFVFEEGRDVGNTYGEYTGADGAILKVNTGAEGVESNGVTITTNNVGIEKYVSFSSRGLPKLVNGSSQSGVFIICDDRGLKNTEGNVIARAVVLNSSGRVRVTKDEARIGGVCP